MLKKPELRNELLESVRTARDLMYETLKRVPMKSGEIFCFDPATDDEFEQINLALQMIDEEFDVQEMMSRKKVILQDYDKLYHAINEHCVLGHYMFSFLKCDKQSCSIPQICQNKHLDASQFLKLHHLPFPIPNRWN